MCFTVPRWSGSLNWSVCRALIWRTAAGAAERPDGLAETVERLGHGCAAEEVLAIALYAAGTGHDIE